MTLESELRVTRHPLQRAGAHAVAELAGRSRAVEVTTADLDAVVLGLVADVCATAVAAKGTSRYDWWKVLFALYPNSKATHSKRSSDPQVLRPEIEELFAPDGSSKWPCSFCSAGAAVVWAKSNLPLFDTSRAVNSLPPGVAGWPVCRGCRVSMWALPYGGWASAGSVTVLVSEDGAAEREFARLNVLRARRVMHAGFGRLGAEARAERAALAALRGATQGLSAAALWTFKNDNQEPWLRVTRTGRAVPVFLARVDGTAVLRRGWRLLQSALHRRDKAGLLVRSGADEAARLLFEAEDGRSRSLLAQLHYLLVEVDDSFTLDDRYALTRLAFTYAEEVLGMTTDLQQVATLLATWIERGSSPRGRLAEYKRVALSDFQLGELLMRASTRLMLDQSATAVPQVESWRALIERRPRAWEQRMLLFAQVAVELQARGVQVGARELDPQEEQRIQEQANAPVFAESGVDRYDDDEMGAV